LKKNLQSYTDFGKGTKLYSIVKLKCPKCQEGNLFLSQNPYNLKLFDKMPDKCPVCGEDFVRESGFYWGAMMVSHATTTVIAVIVHLSVFHYYGWAIAPNVIAIVSIILLLFPIVFRNSRAIWINIFINYDSKFQKKEIIK
jgi:uncharacterized protein (DUF983 family)